MSEAVGAGAGRPLRMLLLLGLGLGVWIMLRLPILGRDFVAARGEVPGAAEVRPLRLVSVNSGGVAAAGGNEIAVAQARVAVAQAELALAQAQLALVRAQRGEGFVVPPGYAAVPAPVYAPQYAPAPVVVPYRAVREGRALVPDYGYELPPSRVRKVAAGEAKVAAPLPPAVPAGLPAGHEYAAAAYARLREGDRRGAATLFDAALAAGPVRKDDPVRAAWAAERKRLGRRWAGEIYSLFRDGGAVGPTASPVLGGGQTGINANWTYDPLARRPVAVTARFNTATSRAGAPDNRTSQAAFGVRWAPVTGVNITAERLVRVGDFARNDWNLRVAGGADGRRGRVEWNVYGEAGALGSGDLYGGAQARAGVPVLRFKQAAFVAGAGAWGSVQTARFLDERYALGRFDLGPTLVMRAPVGRTQLELSADYRFRLAGGAFPGSGPAVTLSTGF